jgi:membrane-bound lytic murein transglycosylase D
MVGLDLLSLWVALAAPGLLGLDPERPAAPAPPSSLAPPALLTTRGLDTAGPPPAALEVPLDHLTVPVTLNGPVREFIDFFQGRGRFIYARWYARMGRYRALMLPILERHGLPPEMLYLCMIESGFDPDAVSRAGAVGPWQFIRSTARRYGLRYDDWVDARRDPVLATDAAARHLADLYARFGSWPLAMAAYNAGIGAVAQAIEQTGSNDFWQLAAAGALPDEATRYVPKIMAAIIIGQAPARFGFDQVRPEPALRFAVVPVPGGSDLRPLARKAGVALDELTALNAALRRGYTPPDGQEYPLRVPEAATEPLRAAVEALHARPPGLLIEHTVRFGERLRDIARRYGVRRRELRRLNELPEGQPTPGQVLVVPKIGEPGPDVPDGLMVAARPELDFDVPGRALVYFPVRRRTEVAEVAAFFGVAPGEVGMWNSLDPAVPLQRGMVLRLYVPEDFDRTTAVLVEPTQVTVVTPGSDAAEKALEHAKRKPSAPIKHVEHVVRRGQTPWKIARRYDVSVEELLAANGLTRDHNLSVGQTLKVPTSATPKARGRAKKRAPKREARGGRRYKVKAGDSLWTIARRHDVKVKDLRRRNGLAKSDGLRPGQVLLIP